MGITMAAQSNTQRKQQYNVFDVSLLYNILHVNLLSSTHSFQSRGRIPKFKLTMISRAVSIRIQSCDMSHILPV